jgi:nitrate reductase NapE component
MGIAFSVPVGFAFALNIPILSGALQQLSPDAMRGRVMSFFSMAMFGLRPLFSLSAGGLASLVSPTVVMITFVLFPLVALRLVGATSRALTNARAGAASVAAPA